LTFFGMQLQALSHEICQLWRASSQALRGPLGRRLRWKGLRAVEFLDERQKCHPPVRAGVPRGRPQDRELRIEYAAFRQLFPRRLKQRFAEEQLRGHAADGPQVQVWPVSLTAQ
jgi:hypothetical protein